MIRFLATHYKTETGARVYAEYYFDDHKGYRVRKKINGRMQFIPYVGELVDELPNFAL